MGTVTISGQSVLVDVDNLSLFKQWTWFINPGGYVNAREYIGYQRETNKRLSRYHQLHRLITDAPEGMEVDHINGDKLDNRRENLRVCTKTQNQHNRKKSKNNTSGYVGVSYDKSHPNKPWKASISVDNTKKNIGRYSTKEEAALAYNEVALECRGEYAKLNTVQGG